MGKVYQRFQGRKLRILVQNRHVFLVGLLVGLGIGVLWTANRIGRSQPIVAASPAAPAWSRSAATPPPRSELGMVYDSIDGYVIMFGGYGNGVLYGDTWTYSDGTWKNIAANASPPARAEMAITYDEGDGYVLLFGGSTVGNSPKTVFGDTWKFAGGVWAQLNPPISPQARTTASMTYDSKDGYVILFGGLASDGTTYLADTWKFKAGNWTQISSSNGPSPRGAHEIAYSQSDHEVLLFGGSSNFYSSSAGLGDSWTFSDGLWTRVFPARSPGPRDSFGIAYDDRLGSIIVNGGWVPAGACGNEVAETWAFSGGNWAELTGPGPSARQGMGIAYDSLRGNIILFGGQENPGASPSTGCGTPTWDDDTWELGYSSNSSHASSQQQSPQLVFGLQPALFYGSTGIATGALVGGLIVAVFSFRRRENRRPIASSTSLVEKSATSQNVQPRPCQYCGTFLPLEAAFCGRCGKKLGEAN